MPADSSSEPTEITDRHREILREALRLFAERGYAGASLRELARRVGMKQPSLYHYFKSKDELVEQLLEHMAVGFSIAGEIPPPANLEAVPQMLAGIVPFLYEHTDWGLFVRFVFSLSLSEPRFGPRLKALFVDRMELGLEGMMGPFIERGEIGREDAHFFVRLTLNAMALLLIEQKILYPGEPDVVDVSAFADFVARFVSAALPTIRRSPSS